MSANKIFGLRWVLLIVGMLWMHTDTAHGSGQHAGSRQAGARAA